MNKLFGYGRTRTRLSLILLSALAFLCIAIVCMCVFNNLNALATNNIAYAEVPDEENIIDEPSREIGGLYEDNLIPYNYADGWSFTTTSIINNQLTLFEDTDFIIYIDGSAQITDNYIMALGNGFSLIFKAKTNLNVSSNHVCSVGFYANGTYTFQAYTNSTLSTISTSAGSGFRYKHNFTFNGYANDYVCFNVASSFNITLHWICLQNASYFRGYVSPDYQYYGYNQGYADGVESAGNVEPPEFTNSTGLVGSNQLKYSYWVDADFSVESTSGYTTIYEQDNQRIQVQAGNLSGNTLTSVDYRSTRTALYYRVPKPSGAYTLAVYISAVHGLWNFGVVNTEYLIDLEQGLNVIHVPAPSESRESRDGYIQFNILATDINDEITISWFKLEDGDAFTGYVAPDNSNSYEAGYEQGVIDGYNQGLSDLNNAMSYLNNSFMQTKGPYYVESVTNSVDPNDSTFEIIEHAFFSDVSGVTYGNYVPVYFALNMDFPIGSDLHWIINGTLNIYTSLSTPEELHTIHYGFYDSLSFITYGPEYVPWQNTISYTSNITDLTFHANYSGSFLVMWLYTDNTSPYVKFTYRTPIVDNSFSFDPYSFAYNTYSLSATEVVDAARQQGFSEGFNTGYNQGKFENSSSQTYTFKNLIGAVFDAPITALVGKYDEETDARIGGLLNFEILGVNLGGFVIGLLSLAIILFVLRVFMRGL